MTRFELVSVEVDRVEGYLEDGWEPFAVTSYPLGEDIVWLRRPKRDEA